MWPFQAALNDFFYLVQLFSQNINNCSEASPNEDSSEASISTYDKRATPVSQLYLVFNLIVKSIKKGESKILNPEKMESNGTNQTDH